jgi:hypothetical protein
MAGTATHIVIPVKFIPKGAGIQSLSLRTPRLAVARQQRGVAISKCLAVAGTATLSDVSYPSEMSDYFPNSLKKVIVEKFFEA